VDDGHIKMNIRDGIACIVIDRYEKRNAMTSSMFRQLTEQIEIATRNAGIRVIIVTGVRNSFCSGADLAELVSQGDALERKRWLFEEVNEVVLRMQFASQLFIAGINGAALGAGLDLALGCDLRYMAKSAFVSESYIQVGLLPGEGGTYFLPRMIGLTRALELILTGRRVPADEARSLGLVNDVWQDADFAERLTETAQAIASLPADAISFSKRATHAAFQTDLRTHLDMVSSHNVLLQLGTDFQKRVEGFLRARDREGG